MYYLTFSFIIKLVFSGFHFFSPSQLSEFGLRKITNENLIRTRQSIFLFKIMRVIISLSIILTSLLLPADLPIYAQQGKPNASVALAGIDTTFAPRLENHGFVEKTFLQPDGKTVVIGKFDKIGNSERKNIARLNADGTADAAVNPPENVSTLYLEPLPSGKFISITNDGVIVRLNSEARLITVLILPAPSRI